MMVTQMGYSDKLGQVAVSQVTVCIPECWGPWGVTWTAVCQAMGVFCACSLAQLKFWLVGVRQS